MAIPNPNTRTTSTTLHLTSLTLPLTLSHDAWSRPSKPQPIAISLGLVLREVPRACESDELGGTFSYSSVYAAVVGGFGGGGKGGDGRVEGGLEEVARRVVVLACGGNRSGGAGKEGVAWPVHKLDVEIVAPKGVLRTIGAGTGDEGGGAGLRYSCSLDIREGWEISWAARQEKWDVRGLGFACVIGVNEHERLEKQSVVLDLGVGFEEGGLLRIWPGEEEIGRGREREEGFWQGLVRRVGEVVEGSEFLTVERLASVVGEAVCVETRGRGGEGVKDMRVRIRKLEAYALAGSVGCEVVVESA